MQANFYKLLRSHKDRANVNFRNAPLDNALAETRVFPLPLLSYYKLLHHYYLTR